MRSLQHIDDWKDTIKKSKQQYKHKENTINNVITEL